MKLLLDEGFHPDEGSFQREGFSPFETSQRNGRNKAEGSLTAQHCAGRQSRSWCQPNALAACAAPFEDKAASSFAVVPRSSLWSSLQKAEEEEPSSLAETSGNFFIKDLLGAYFRRLIGNLCNPYFDNLILRDLC